MTDRIKGVLSPVVTPFTADLEPDAARWLEHCRWLVSQDCGLAIFGTNSEANSLSVDDRLALLDALGDSDIDPSVAMPGTGSCAIPDAVALTRRAMELKPAGMLMLPPFYYKNMSDEGLFRYFSEVIERVGAPDLRIYLYHIPPVAQVPISLDLIARLKERYPGTIVGIKDSSGDWANTQAMLERFEDFDVFAGSEEFLLATLRSGGAGCISATANINPGAIAALGRTWQEGDADSRQEELTAFRHAVARLPMIPALKGAIALARNDPEWFRVRPPLVELDEAQREELRSTLEAHGVSVPGALAAE